MKYLLPVIILFFNTNLIYTQTNNGSVELKYLFTLVNGENQNRKEYLYKNPSDLHVDINNNIYAIDSRGTEIRKYSKDGKYLSTIGRVGNGPGEFQEIYSYDVFKEKIIVRGSVSNMTEYLTDGTLLRTFRLNLRTCNFDRLWHYTDDRYMVLKYDYESTIKNLFYVYDNKLEKEITSFGHPTIMFDVNSPIYQNERAVMNVLILKNGDVVVAKKYYDGKLYRFSRDKNWSHTIFSSDKQYKPYRVFSPYISGKENYNNVIAFSDNTSNKMIGILLRTMSAGLVQYENKYILNFVVQFNNYNKESELGVEVYDLNCKYLGYYKLDNKEIVLKYVRTKVYSIDNDNCILMSDFVHGMPQVKKFKMYINIKQ